MIQMHYIKINSNIKIKFNLYDSYTYVHTLIIFYIIVHHIILRNNDLTK